MADFVRAVDDEGRPARIIGDLVPGGQRHRRPCQEAVEVTTGLREGSYRYLQVGPRDVPALDGIADAGIDAASVAGKGDSRLEAAAQDSRRIEHALGERGAQHLHG